MKKVLAILSNIGTTLFLPYDIFLFLITVIRNTDDNFTKISVYLLLFYPISVVIDWVYIFKKDYAKSYIPLLHLIIIMASILFMTTLS